MRYNAEHKQRTREAILGAAGRVFRAEGYGGSGIDGLTRAAGVTNGAFYGHFKTKAEAFTQVVEIGLRELREGVERFQAEHGAGWLAPFADFYLGWKRVCDIREACALPTLSAEVARADDATRAAYQEEFRLLVAATAAGLGGDEARATAVLALLSGAATLARAVPDPELGARVAANARAAALALAAG
jgi:AcrR family transcriptional regulator